MKFNFLLLCLFVLLKQLCAQDCISKFRQEALQSHNFFRSIHGSPPLTEINQLTQSAQSYAEFMAVHDLFKNSGELPGENLFMLSGVILKNCTSKKRFY